MFPPKRGPQYVEPCYIWIKLREGGALDQARAACLEEVENEDFAVTDGLDTKDMYLAWCGRHGWSAHGPRQTRNLPLWEGNGTASEQASWCQIGCCAGAEKIDWESCLTVLEGGEKKRVLRLGW